MRNFEVKSAVSNNDDKQVLRVGDLIAAYRPGYHVITRIEVNQYEEGDGYSRPDYVTVYYRQVCDVNGRRSKHAKAEHCCGIWYCHLATKHLAVLREQISAVEKTLQAYQQDKK